MGAVPHQEWCTNQLSRAPDVSVGQQSAMLPIALCLLIGDSVARIGIHPNGEGLLDIGSGGFLPTRQPVPGGIPDSARNGTDFVSHDR
jgi:hypothetical protein